MLAFAGQLVFTGNLTWNEALTITFRDWVPWVVLAPAAGWLAMKFPLEWQRLHISIPVHVVACMLAVLACEYFPRPSVQQPGRVAAGGSAAAAPGLPRTESPAEPGISPAALRAPTGRGCPATRGAAAGTGTSRGSRAAPRARSEAPLPTCPADHAGPI
jgi:hypothetical protein